MSGGRYEKEAYDTIEARAWLESYHDWGVVIRPKHNDGKLICELPLMRALRDWLNIQIDRVERIEREKKR